MSVASNPPSSAASSPGSMHDLPEPEQDDIFTLQTRKAELAQERDDLAVKRYELKQSIERLSSSLTHYKKQQSQFETRQKLEYYLHQNDQEHASLPQADEAAAFVLKNINVLPATDVNLRMELIDKFYPLVTVTQDSVSTAHVNDKLLTIMSYRISASSLPPLSIRLSVSDEAIENLELLQWSEVNQLLHKVSPSFSQVFTRNYLRLKKIDLIMYSYHSLAQLQQVRSGSMSQIIQNYSEVVTKPAPWALRFDSSLTTHSLIELTIHEKTKGEVHIVRLQWDLVLEQTAVGNVESKLQLQVIKGETGLLKDANEVFATLIAQHGIVHAFSLMLHNLFGL